jgi:uncharacterized membrane protein YhaH (DUF805 family)
VARYPNNYRILRLATRPILLAFRFGGRSTRSEVVGYYLLWMVMNAFSFHWEHDGTSWDPLLRAFSDGWAFIWCWPWFPLLVRRLHDQPRSGWWSLVSPMVIPIGLILALTPGLEGHSAISVTMPFAGTRHLSGSPPTIALVLLGAMSFLATTALYLWAPTPFANRYGPDPRVQPDGVSPA